MCSHSTLKQIDLEPGVPVDAAELLQLLDSNVDNHAFILLDRTGVIRKWNKGAELLLGYSEREVLGTSGSFLFGRGNEGILALKDDLDKALVQGRLSAERNYSSKTGSRFWAASTMIPLRDEAGQLRGFANTIVDISNWKLTEELMRYERLNASAAAEKIVDLNRLLRDEMIEVHHRIKNSFQTLASQLEIQIGRKGVDASGEDYRKVALHVRSLAAIQDVLTQSAIKANEFGQMSVSDFLNRIIPLVQSTVPDRRLTARIDDLQLPTAMVTSLSLLLSELISNAIKHGNGGIDVSFTVKADIATLVVSNEGNNLPSDFDPIESANTGLLLIDRLAHSNLRGMVQFENRKPSGVRVTVTFPASPR